MRRKVKLFTVPLISALLFLLLASFVNAIVPSQKEKVENAEAKIEETQEEKEPEFVKELKNDFKLQYQLFRKAKLENNKFVYNTGNYRIIFTVDPRFQEAVENEFKRFKIKYGAYVALDPKTGDVIAAVSSLKYPNLLFKRSFPTASTFKIVTAAAALDTGIATPKTELNCGGLGDSCSPSVWLNSPYRVERVFSQSFATSANPFFGNLGRLIGKKKLMEYAYRFGFNRRGYNFPWGVLREPLDDYELALMAAGLGDTVTSPFHEALIAQTIVNGGVMVKPHIVEKVIDLKTGKEYDFKPVPIGRVVKEKTADEIKKMMVLTVKIGTVANRRYFRLLRKYSGLTVGGKTGTLTERSYPEGRCEWFTGFMSYGGKTLAVSSVAVNNWLYYLSGYEISAVAAADFVKLQERYAKGGKKCASSVR